LFKEDGLRHQGQGSVKVISTDDSTNSNMRELEFSAIPLSDFDGAPSKTAISINDKLKLIFRKLFQMAAWKWKRVQGFFRRNALLFFTLLAVVAGTTLALLILKFGPPLNKRQIKAFRFPGEIFLRALNMIILPLIVSSIVCGLADLDTSSSGRMGGVAIAYYFTTTVVAAIEGIVCVVSIRPGDGVTNNKAETPGKINAADNIMDLIRNMVPSNLIAATFQKYKTVTKSYPFNVTLPNDTVVTTIESDPQGSMAAGSNILGLVVFSVLLGVVLSRMGEEGAPLVRLFRCLNGAVMRIVSLFMWYSPIGILFLICGQILQTSNFLVLLSRLGLYIATVLVGHFLHAVVALPLIYFIVVRKNPFRYILRTSEALLTAFGTSSSSATLPVTMRCVVEKCHVDSRVAQFVLPIGATINMDGTALYEAIAALFIAQLHGIALDVGQIITVSLTATLASIGAAGIPTAGMVTMIIVLNAVNLPVEDISLLLAVDWFLDRFRTAANVSGDTIGAAIVQKLCQRHLPPQLPIHAKSAATSLSQSPSDATSVSTNNNDPNLSGGGGGGGDAVIDDPLGSEEYNQQESHPALTEDGAVKSTKF